MVYAQCVFANDPYKVTGYILELNRGDAISTICFSVYTNRVTSLIFKGRSFHSNGKTFLIMKRGDTNLSEVTRMKKMERESRLK
jgi:hypothetical protein